KSQNDNLVERIHEIEISSCRLQKKVTVYENCMEQLEKFQDDRMKAVNDKFDKLYTDFVEMTLHLEEKFYPHLLTIIFGRRWLLTQGMELAIIKCLNSHEYLFALGAAISKAIKKGMQDGLSAGITHDKEGMVLTDVAAYNPFAKADFCFATAPKWPLTDKLVVDELQPNVDQLMVPIHHAPNKVFIGPTALSLALDVSNIRIEGTSDVVSATGGATTTLSRTFSSASTITPIFVDDYKVIDAEDQAAADRNAASFPNTFQVSGSCFPSRSLNLYAPFPSASVTSYGPSHLRPSFSVSFARLASLLRSRLISKASLFCTKSTSAVFNVGMLIFAGMTASVSYINENGVSPLLDFIMAREEEIESLKARLLLKEAKAAEAIRLRAEASNFETVEKYLRDETNALRERNIILKKEQNALDVKVTELETSVVSKEHELTDLNALVTSVKSQNDNLVERAPKEGHGI
nr:transposase (putative), gypsy type [Tanacetum cinerariifolium]